MRYVYGTAGDGALLLKRLRFQGDFSHERPQSHAGLYEHSHDVLKPADSVELTASAPRACACLSAVMLMMSWLMVTTGSDQAHERPF